MKKLQAFLEFAVVIDADEVVRVFQDIYVAYLFGFFDEAYAILTEMSQVYVLAELQVAFGEFVDDLYCRLIHYAGILKVYDDLNGVFIYVESAEE